MATVKNTLHSLLLNYPSIFPNALYAYDHLFLTLGNGAYWSRGQLMTSSHNHSLKKAVITNLADSTVPIVQSAEVFEYSYEKGAGPIFNTTFNTTTLSNHIKTQFNQVIHDIALIFDVKNRAQDFEFVPGFPFDGFRIHKDYSAISMIPDNVTEDWLFAAEYMYFILVHNRDLIKEGAQMLPAIDRRIYKLSQNFPNYQRVRYHGPWSRT